MKLDDRPVIDQLLNPTPLNIVEDVAHEFRLWLQRLATQVDHSTQWLEGASEMLNIFADELEARL